MTRFGINLKSIVMTRLAPQARVATLHVHTSGAWKAGKDAGKERTTANHPCRAYRVDIDSALIDGQIIRKGDCEIRVYTGSLPAGVVPSAKDSITVAGVQYEIVHVNGEQDLSDAVYSLQARGLG